MADAYFKVRIGMPDLIININELSVVFRAGIEK